MRKQTTTEWLIDCLSIHLTDEQKTQFEGLFQQAGQMNKKEIEESYMQGAFAKMRHFDGKEFVMSTEYYEKTYGGNND